MEIISGVPIFRIFTVDTHSGAATLLLSLLVSTLKWNNLPLGQQILAYRSRLHFGKFSSFRNRKSQNLFPFANYLQLYPYTNLFLVKQYAAILCFEKICYGT